LWVFRVLWSYNLNLLGVCPIMVTFNKYNKFLFDSYTKIFFYKIEII
jgi:hypothetical protein